MVTFESPLNTVEVAQLQQRFLHVSEWNGCPFYQSEGVPELHLWFSALPTDTAAMTVEVGWNVTLASDISQILAWAPAAADPAASSAPPQDSWHVPPYSVSPALVRCVPVAVPAPVDAGDAAPVVEYDEDESEFTEGRSGLAAGSGSSGKGKGKGKEKGEGKGSGSGLGVQRTIDRKARPPKPSSAPSSSSSGAAAPPMRPFVPPPPPPPPSRAGHGAAAPAGPVQPSFAPPMAAASSKRPSASGSSARAAAAASGQQDQRRGGWMNKCQSLAEAVLSGDEQLATQLAAEYYCGPDREYYVGPEA